MIAKWLKPSPSLYKCYSSKLPLKIIFILQDNLINMLDRIEYCCIVQFRIYTFENTAAQIRV